LQNETYDLRPERAKAVALSELKFTIVFDHRVLSYADKIRLSVLTLQNSFCIGNLTNSQIENQSTVLFGGDKTFSEHLDALEKLINQSN